MKKIMFSLAVLCSVALVSCGGKKAEEAVDTDTLAAVEEVAVVTDSANDSAAAVAVEAVEEAPVADSAK